MKHQVKAALARMGDFIIGRRWVTVASYGMLAAWSAAAGVVTAFDPQPSAFILACDFIVVGWSVSQIMWTMALPGLFQGIKEADRATMQDQMQAEIDRAWKAFRARHPEFGEDRPDVRHMN
jgi:hypothetical protein